MEADVRDDITAGRLVRVLEDLDTFVGAARAILPGRKNLSAFSVFIQAARDTANG